MTAASLTCAVAGSPEEPVEKFLLVSSQNFSCFPCQWIHMVSLPCHGHVTAYAKMAVLASLVF